MFCGANLLLKIKNNIVKSLFGGKNVMSMHLKEPLMSPANALKFVTCEPSDAHNNDASGNFRVLPTLFKGVGVCGFVRAIGLMPTRMAWWSCLHRC